MSLGGRRLLWTVLALGVVGRLVISFATYGSVYDIESFVLAADQLRESPLEFYAGLEALGRSWPYPPLYFPWIVGADALSEATFLPFHAIIALPSIAADAAIAWIVQDYVGRRGASERDRLLAASLVAFGPAFVLISGYHGQIDSVAILPAVAALAVWDRGGGGQRAPLAGFLIGLGAAVKSVPIVMLLALLPSRRDLREGVTLVAAALGTLFAVVLPWLISEPGHLIEGLSYTGVPGAGGITLVVQPEMAARWLTEWVEPNAVHEFLFDNRKLVNALIAASLAAFLLRRRSTALRAAVITWLAIWAFGTGFFFQYLVWGLPFLIMAGHWRLVVALQALVVVPAYLFYTGPWESSGVVPVYATLMILLWAIALAGLLVLGRREIADPPMRA
jgi:uncharacterized membrane protein